MMVAQGGFDKKEEVENPSEVLLNPSDPEATFRYKAGGRHLGYVGNVVEAVGEKSSLVIVYDYQQNTYADNQFMKDYLNEKKDFSDGSFIVADGVYSGEENSRLASEHNLKLVTTNFTGRKPDEIYADFVFTDDGKYLIKCKNNCVPEDCIYACDIYSVTVMSNTVNDRICQRTVITAELVIPFLEFILRAENR